MSEKQASLESFFEKRERPNDETTEVSKTAPPPRRRRIKLHFKENTKNPTEIMGSLQ